MIIKLTRNFRSLKTYGKYELKYTLGEITEALPGTVGIFCYDDEREAIRVFNKNVWNILNLFSEIEIWEAEGIGEPKKRVKYSDLIGSGCLDSFYDESDFLEEFIHTSTGKVVCYPTIKLIRRLNPPSFICEV